MPFQPGNKLAAGGRKDKPWADALRLAMLEDDRKALRDIAEVVKSLAQAGDMQAIKEIGDRLDGKPAQESMVTVRNELDSMNDAELRDFIRRELETAGGAGVEVTESPDTRVTH